MNRRRRITAAFGLLTRKEWVAIVISVAMLVWFVALFFLWHGTASHLYK